MARPDVEYVLPLRWRDDRDLHDLTAYLARLSRTVDVTVVDGSEPQLFRRHAQAWDGLVRHLPPEPWPGRNGKVRNVVTGLRAARHPVVVVADDDVRWTATTLDRALALMDGADLLVPQNVFTTWPWHARWDTGRQLLNRAWGGDYPGTLVLRRDILGADGYDGDVLFENLELIREVRRRGGVVRRAPGLYVGRRPPTAGHFWSQRVRQAYDDFAQPARLLVEASVLPLVLAAGRRRTLTVTALAGAAALMAEHGRRRAGGARVFPASAAAWAPAWLVERSVCVWAAVLLRLRGGVRYSEGRLLHAVSPARRRPVSPAVLPVRSLPPTTREAAMTDVRRPPTITAYPDGPLVVRGDVELRTVDGVLIPQRDGPVALCRCGLSSIKPFCDATHKRSKFRAE